MILRKTRSQVLKATQTIILATRLNYVLKPFAGGFQKLYCLSGFADWKKTVKDVPSLKGYSQRFELYAKIIETEQIDLISYLEFGVSKGESIKWWLTKIANKDSRFYGFDTFDGIPEDWGTKPRGSYTNNGNIPLINDPRCKCIQGLFQNTLPEFLKQQEPNRRLVVHLDADLYSSTLFCLCSLANHLKAGDLLIFDEFNITAHEFRAFLDFKTAYPMNMVFIGESNQYNKVVFKII